MVAVVLCAPSQAQGSMEDIQQACVSFLGFGTLDCGLRGLSIASFY